MKERCKVQALDPTCGVWLSGQIISVEDGHFHLKWIGYDQTARLPKNSVREPILKRLWKPSKSHWPSSDPRSLQRGDKVVHLQPNGQDGPLLQVEENDPWNCKIKVDNRFYLYEHLREVRDVVPEADTSGRLNDDGGLSTCQGKVKLTKQFPVQEKRVSKTAKVTPQQAKSGKSRRQQPLQELRTQADGVHANESQKVQRKPLKEVVVQSTQNAQAKPDKNKRKRKEPEEKNVAKKKSVTKEAARPLAVGQPWDGPKSTPLNQEEKELAESISPKDIENCPPDLLLKYGMAALEELDNHEEENEVEELPPPLSPLSPVVTTDLLDRTDLRTVVDLMRLSFEEEQRKRKAVEERLRAIEVTLEQLVQEKVHVPQTPAAQAPVGQPPFTPEQQQKQPPMPPPQTPLVASLSGNTNEESTHNEKLRKIFSNVLTTPEYAPNGSITSYTLQPEVLRDLSWFAQSPQSMARELMRKMFTPYELSTSNVRGIRKAALDPTRIETIRKTVFNLCTVPPYLRTTVWKDCVKSMDQANRNAKKLNYSTFS